MIGLVNCSFSVMSVVPGFAVPMVATSGLCAPGAQMSSEPDGMTPSLGADVVWVKSVLNVETMPETVAGLSVVTRKPRIIG
jgi:hypothetical protein